MKKHQIKSGWYYIFWGIMSVSVFAGQLYVGNGYRQLSNSIDQIKIILLEQKKNNQNMLQDVLVLKDS